MSHLPHLEWEMTAGPCVCRGEVDPLRGVDLASLSNSCHEVTGSSCPAVQRCWDSCALCPVWDGPSPPGLECRAGAASPVAVTGTWMWLKENSVCVQGKLAPPTHLDTSRVQQKLSECDFGMELNVNTTCISLPLWTESKFLFWMSLWPLLIALSCSLLVWCVSLTKCAAGGAARRGLS